MRALMSENAATDGRSHRTRRRAAAVLAAAALTFGFGLVVAGQSAAVPASGYVRDCPARPLPGTATCLSLHRRAVSQRAVSSADVVGPPAGYGPADLQSAYNIASEATADGGGMIVGIVDAFDNPNLAGDLSVYRTAYGLAACPLSSCLQKWNQHGTTSPLPASDTVWADGEIQSAELISAVCPRCRIDVFEADSPSDVDLEQAIARASNIADVVLMGWGATPTSSESGFDATGFAHPGRTYVAASGDTPGATLWPSIASGVVSVGATTLTRSANSSRGWAESAWYKQLVGAGSGCDTQESKPSWQAHDPDLVACDGRAVNDISAVGDPTTGVAVYDSLDGSRWSVSGGSSASASIIAGMYGLTGHQNLAPAPNVLYGRRTGSGLNDVTAGGNPALCTVARFCAAQAGWDGPTGLGTPNGLTALQPSSLSLTPVSSQTAAVGAAAQVQVAATDGQGASITFGADGLPPGLAIDSTTGLISGVPALSGRYSITAWASDPTTTVTTTFTWLVALHPMSALVSGASVYGHAPTITVFPSVPGVTVSGTTCTTIDGGQPLGHTPAGSYTLDGAGCGGGMTSDPLDYAVTSYVDGQLTVARAPLTVSPLPDALSYGERPTGPPFAMLTGLQYSDGPDSLTPAPTCAFVTDPTYLPAGAYPGLAACTQSSSPNYVITNVTATVTIQRIPVTVTVDGTRTHGGPVVFVPSVSQPGATASGVQCARDSAGDLLSGLGTPGEYLIDGHSCSGAVLSNPNYVVSAYGGHNFAVQPFGLSAENLPLGLIGKPYSGKLTAAGGSNLTWSLSGGNLPPGLQMATSGAITGTPTTDGTYPVRVTAHGTPAGTQEQVDSTVPVDLVVARFDFLTVALGNPLIGRTYSAALKTYGGKGTETFSIFEGTLPPGVKLSAAGQLTGTATVPFSGWVTVQVSDSSAPKNVAKRSFLLTVLPMQVKTSSLPDARVGTSYSSQLATTAGKAPINWAITSGTLPAGLTLSTSGLLSGTPTTVVTETVTVQARDTATPQNRASATFTVVVLPMQITTSALPNGAPGKFYTAKLTAVGGKQPLVWKVTAGALPPGLTMTTAGQISGLPSTQGDYVFTVTVTDHGSPVNTASEQFAIVTFVLDGHP